MMKTIVAGNLAPAASSFRPKVSRTGVPGVLKSQRRPLGVTAAVAADSALDIATMEPLGERVLVKPMEIEEKSEGGILLPTSATEQDDSAKFGEVLAVGEGVELGLNKGDKIIYVSESVAHVELSDGEITFVNGKSVMAIMS